MNNVLGFPDRSRIEIEAGEWLIRLDSDSPPSAKELAALREWLERSPVHREELTSLIRFYDKMNILTELSVPLGKGDRVSEHATKKGSGRILSKYRLPYLAAAVLSGVALALSVWFQGDSIAPSSEMYATTVGEQRTITLADGSEVHLNTDTQIKVDYGELYRYVHLVRGEGYFTVAKMPDRPFRVYAGRGQIEALGTAFAVYLKDDIVDVTVTHGQVALAGLDPLPHHPTMAQLAAADPMQPTGDDADSARKVQKITLEAGQRTTIDGRPNSDSRDSELGEIEMLEEAELARRLSWRNGLLSFAGQPLAQVVDEIGRYSTVKVEITDPAVRAISVGGQFRIGDTEALFDTLELNFGLEVTRIGYDHVQIAAAEKL